MRHLDLFSGIGGFSLAAQKIGKIQTTQFVEIDPDAQRVLKHYWPEIPIWPDITSFHTQPGQFDIITGGFPCTNTSSAGDRTGINGEHSSLWFEMLRVIQENKEAIVCIENPTGLLNRGMGKVLQGLYKSGYDAEWETISAHSLGAPHRRDRLFIVAYPYRWCEKVGEPIAWADQIRAVVSEQRTSSRFPVFERRDDRVAYGLPPELGAVPVGVPRGTPGRIRSRYLYGRSVVPACAAIALARAKYLFDFFCC